MSITEIPKLLVYGRLKVQWKQFQKYGIPSIDRKLGTLLAPLLKANSMVVFNAANSLLWSVLMVKKLKVYTCLDFFYKN